MELWKLNPKVQLTRLDVDKESSKNLNITTEENKLTEENSNRRKQLPSMKNIKLRKQTNLETAQILQRSFHQNNKSANISKQIDIPLKNKVINQKLGEEILPLSPNIEKINPLE